ncbi:hypothetical protein BT96DRAFT_947942 [Gymnopus androsaceus JB14]|uniref:Uncharacterized protein n=1 Tax=Gymnopus androsaceus JB14 TaxID=1447944 RepID=A0A6A4GQ80_9AGAR|nr:hypothetical protein BT96DRAFT_947942 [Gymnopus androsaceus JB14]
MTANDIFREIDKFTDKEILKAAGKTFRRHSRQLMNSLQGDDQLYVMQRAQEEDASGMVKKFWEEYVADEERLNLLHGVTDCNKILKMTIAELKDQFKYYKNVRKDQIPANNTSFNEKEGRLASYGACIHGTHLIFHSMAPVDHMLEHLQRMDTSDDMEDGLDNDLDYRDDGSLMKFYSKPAFDCTKSVKHFGVHLDMPFSSGTRRNMQEHHFGGSVAVLRCRCFLSAGIITRQALSTWKKGYMPKDCFLVLQAVFNAKFTNFSSFSWYHN